MIDLHLHTTASDGSLSPEELVYSALELGYKAISITDHDTVQGVEPALNAARKTGLRVIPGIEINTDVEKGEAHILGYYIDHQSPNLLATLEELQEMRRKRAARMLDRLSTMGIEISWEYLQKLATGKTIGRAHIARAMLEKGYVGSFNEAFQKYIGKECPAYVPRERLTPRRAIELIKDSQGIPVLAHPGLLAEEYYLTEMVKLGIKGLEVFYLEHTPEQIKKLCQFARKHQLIMTGGSDDHGPGNKDGARLGRVRLSVRRVDELKKAWKNMQI